MYRNSSTSDREKSRHKRSESGDKRHESVIPQPAIGDDTKFQNYVEEHKQQQQPPDDLQIQTANTHSDQGLIYAVPTVDTLGTDEGTLLRIYQQKPRLQTLEEDDRVRNGPVSITLASATAISQGYESITADVHNKTSQQQLLPPTNIQNRRRPRPPNNNNNTIKTFDREFQHLEDVMTVTARNIPVAERSAFDKKLPAYYGNKKTSPSWQHWQVLQKLNSVKQVQQLAFSPSVGSAADIFWDEELDEREEQEESVNSPQTRRLQRRDGRYRSINPVTGTMAGLPKTPPLLSNKKHRLPMRSDVGFPNATDEEVQRKQREIQQETEWEEASPRLIVLVTSDDLGTAVQAETEIQDGQGLPGMPWAGKDLILAKERNHRHFSKRQQAAASNSNKNNRDDKGNTLTHMLAPPLDAIPSKSLGWRPRPFHDRSPGMTYTLVSPLAVDFAIGKIEPLICSLTLYSLKMGKASEEFYFPAGDWRGKLQLDSLLRESPDREAAQLLTELWQHRKQKAIFAHNATMMGGDDSDLHIVLQVYKVAHVDPATAYWAKGSDAEFASSHLSSSDKKTWRKKLKRHFQKEDKKKSSSPVGVADESDIEMAHLRSNATFEAFGTQLTSFLCFGITPLYPEGTDSTSRNNIWPKGQVQQGMNLYAAPGCSETHEDFLNRLRAVAGYPMDDSIEYLSAGKDGSAAFGVEDSSTASDSVADMASPERKMGSIRKFISPRKGTKKNVGQPSQKSHISMDTPLVPGSVALFSSCLGSDFLQSMLCTPPELIDKVSLRNPKGCIAGATALDSQEVKLPRILVDASADSAIMIDPSKTVSNVISGPDSARRSDLIRMPKNKPAEHLDTSEFREVLFLPPRAERNYECDYLHADNRSLLNLLYLYPRRIAYRPKDTTKLKQCDSKRFTIRIRLVQNLSTANQSGIVESTNRVLDSFHNPAPWCGANLLSSVFTRIPGGNNQKVQHFEDEAREGIPFRDEYKMKLPDILDSSYFLQFTLFSVDFNGHFEDTTATTVPDISSRSSSDDECGMTLQPIGETTIPLCSSSIRDPKSGAKAATVIPNAIHRLRLGDFQFQIESRLISAVHVSDPAIAAALRDFPVVGDMPSRNRSNTEKLEELVLVTSRSVVSRPLSAANREPRFDQVSFPSLFAGASGGSIAAHFQPLLLLHLSNLVRRSHDSDGTTSERFLHENLLSLMVLFRRLKIFFRSNSISSSSFEYFVKNTIDLFDEEMIHGTTRLKDDETETQEFDADLPTPFSNYESLNDEPSDGGAIRRRKRHSVSSNIDLRITRTFSPTDTSRIPFFRKAYGATKTDRMKLEAEIDAETGHFTTLLDDDETVITLATTTRIVGAREAGGQLSEARESPELKNRVSSPTMELFENPSPSANSVAQTPDSSHGIDFQRSLSELALGQRMKSAAQVMLAPCVTPGLSNVFLCKISPRATSSVDNSGKLLGTSQVSEMQNHATEEICHRIVLSGSDLDDDDARKENTDLYFHTPFGLFRGPWDAEKVEFSIPFDFSHKRNFPISQYSYLYESILTLWLQAWVEHLRKIGEPSPEGIFKEFADEGDGAGFFLYHSQMEVLLSFILKSLSLRHARLARRTNNVALRLILDDAHSHVLVSFCEMVGLGLMGQAMAELRNSGEDFTLAATMRKCDVVVDFFIGMCAILHPAHLEVFVRTFLKTLRNSEADDISSRQHEFFEWNKCSLHRAKCSRQLRLRTIEKLAVINNFVALNFPPRFADDFPLTKSRMTNWTEQYGNDSSNAESNHFTPAKLIPDDGLLPRQGWLASLLTNESLSICAISCEAVVAEAMAHIETQDMACKSDMERIALENRPTASLKRDDLLMFQSIAIHAITTVHELLLRRHAMDRRFQKDSSRGRIAALFLQPIFEKSLAGVRWMARMESTHKVRSIWLLCFVYILQEAPESLIREAIRTYSDPHDGRIHRFIRLLRLSSSTFQSFIDQERHCMFPLEIDKAVSPWLLQESFNTVCATTIRVVEESVGPTSYVPNEQRKMIHGILDLLLHVLTTPQSCVTHLRAIGGAIQALEKFGVQMFLEITGLHLQHWIRVVLGLMNSTALSVRSIAVDFVISLLGSLFQLSGNIDDVTMIFATVLPEVAAREIALCSVSGLVTLQEDAEMSLWPLRRSFADIEDANPLDDERVDPQLSPILGTFCRASQAIIDGVLIEMRLRGDNCIVAGTKIPSRNRRSQVFDADEESLYEAANFFLPETSPVQRTRWLMSLKALHEEKGQWVEAAECLIASAMTIASAIPHLNEVWRPSRFPLWYDARRSLWLSTVGEAQGNPEQGNAQVMTFAGSFLEPEWLMPLQEKGCAVSRLQQLDFTTLCTVLTSISKEAAFMFSREECVEVHAYLRLESLLKVLMNILAAREMNAAKSLKRTKMAEITHRKNLAAELVALRKVTASLTGDLAAMVEKLSQHRRISRQGDPFYRCQRLYFVRLHFFGKKPKRFQESTTLPTFLDWDKDCICRIPKAVVDSVLSSTHIDSDRLEIAMCTAFLKLVRDTLLEDLDSQLLMFHVGSNCPIPINGETLNTSDVTHISVCIVQPIDPRTAPGNATVESEDVSLQQSRRFRYRTGSSGKSSNHTLVELTVATAFPSPLSRQRSLLTHEYFASVPSSSQK
ncbi:Dock homology region 2 domain containing protein [Nitzschia inconspicua]|uniref:Dock homology region 2 domain containing protein n=1 Tax=Nitzschia inconspicua TaxID=303405 RepID=A0A9K3KTB9_9STRA|nr:Dock homology region 2 domain containing protein [Nitzschia inconspicua]